VEITEDPPPKYEGGAPAGQMRKFRVEAKDPREKTKQKREIPHFTEFVRNDVPMEGERGQIC
jgi:hypothetical protein